MQQRIGPENPGLSRLLAARVLLVVMASFYLAGATLAVMYALGADPLADHELSFGWPFGWPSGWPWTS